MIYGMVNYVVNMKCSFGLVSSQYKRQLTITSETNCSLSKAYEGSLEMLFIGNHLLFFYLHVCVLIYYYTTLVNFFFFLSDRSIVDSYWRFSGRKMLSCCWL